MIEPKIKDDVIRLLYEGKGTAEIAKTIGIEQAYVVASIRDIQSKFPLGFSEHKGYGDDMIGVSLHPKYKEQMFIFVKEGGFEAEQKKYLDSVQKEAYRKELEIKGLELTLKTAQQNADRAAKEAKSSRIAAWVSAFAAVGVLIWEVVKSIN